MGNNMKPRRRQKILRKSVQHKKRSTRSFGLIRKLQLVSTRWCHIAIIITTDSLLLLAGVFVVSLVLMTMMADPRRPPSRGRNDDDNNNSNSNNNNNNNNNKRQSLRRIAHETLAAVQRGYVDEPVVVRHDQSDAFCRHRITAQIQDTQRHTVFYPHDSPELSRWRDPPPAFLRRAPSGDGNDRQTKLTFVSFSTLKGARYLHSITRPSHPSLPTPHTGILNFASATQPGGGFINGASAQEESIARSSSLYASLNCPSAAQFYKSHRRDDRGGFYTHAMIFSPGVVLFREDDGTWMKPVDVQVVTSPAVNAKVVRQRHNSNRRRHRDHQDDEGRAGAELETRIRQVMTERMARILALFELQGVRNVVLGSFGTGVYQNDVRMVAEIWRHLLRGPQARFARSFDHVLFAIPDTKTLDRFRDGFGA